MIDTQAIRTMDHKKLDALERMKTMYVRHNLVKMSLKDAFQDSTKECLSATKQRFSRYNNSS